MCKKKRQKPTHISITIELPDDEPAPNAADVFLNNFFQTLTYWIFGFIGLALIGMIFA